MKNTKRLTLVAVLAFSAACLAFARSDEDSDGLQLKAIVTDGGSGSGISGTAAVNIGEDGLDPSWHAILR